MKKKKHNYSKLDCCQNEQISTSRLLALKQLLDSQKSIDLAITCEHRWRTHRTVPSASIWSGSFKT